MAPSAKDACPSLHGVRACREKLARTPWTVYPRDVLSLRYFLLLFAVCGSPAFAESYDCDAPAGRYDQKIVPISGAATIIATIRLLEPRDKPPFPPGASIRFRSSKLDETSGIWLFIHPDHPEKLTLSFRKYGETAPTVIGYLPLNLPEKLELSVDKKGRINISVAGRNMTYGDKEIVPDSAVMSCNSGHFVIESEFSSSD